MNIEQSLANRFALIGEVNSEKHLNRHALKSNVCDVNGSILPHKKTTLVFMHSSIPPYGNCISLFFVFLTEFSFKV